MRYISISKSEKWDQKSKSIKTWGKSVTNSLMGALREYSYAGVIKIRATLKQKRRLFEWNRIIQYFSRRW